MVINNLTINGLIDRVVPNSGTYDPEFAESFQNMLTEVCTTRAALNASAEPEDAAAYVSAWSAVISLFASDPNSLAALTAPDLMLVNLDCPGPLDALVPASLGAAFPTHTMAQYLYEATLVDRSARVTKLRIKRMPSTRGKAKIDAKGKAKAKPKATTKAKPKLNTKSKPKGGTKKRAKAGAKKRAKTTRRS